MASPSPNPQIFRASIDITPELTLSTIQFQSETLNTIVSSILVVLIVANFNSMVAKLVNLTHRNHFNYASYLRAYIFSSSDDVSRIFSWLRGENSYLPEHWPPTKKKVVAKRLFYPLLARTAIFVLSIGSIALTVPSSREFNNCGSGDFAPRINFDPTSESNPPRVANSVCSIIDLRTERGETNTTLDFCVERTTDDFGSFEPSEGFHVIVEYEDTEAQVSTTFFQNPPGQPDQKSSEGFKFSLEWSKMSGAKLRSRFLPENLNAEMHFNIVLQALNDMGDKRSVPCAYKADSSTINSQNGNSYKVSREVDCDFNAGVVAKDAEYVVRSGLEWVKQNTLQSRVMVTAGEEEENYNDFNECPYSVSVSRPIVNLIPLAVALLMAFTFNIAVGLTVANHGDIGEVSYHIMKEALGLDITCNPLQESVKNERGVGGSELPLVEFREFNCPDGSSAHGGFFVGQGDTEGHIQFDRRVVSTCSCTLKTLNLSATPESAA